MKSEIKKQLWVDVFKYNLFNVRVTNTKIAADIANKAVDLYEDRFVKYSFTNFSTHPKTCPECKIEVGANSYHTCDKRKI